MACQFYFLPFCVIRSQVLLSNKTNRYFYDLNVLWVTLNENFCEWNETVLSVCLEQTQSFSSEKFLLLLFRCWVTDWTANTGSISLTNSNPIHDPIKHWNTLRISHSHNCWLSVVYYEATKGRFWTTIKLRLETRNISLDLIWMWVWVYNVMCRPQLFKPINWPPFSVCSLKLL